MPHVSFFQRYSVKMPKLNRYLPKEIKQLKFETQLKFDKIISGVTSESFSSNLPVSSDVLNFLGVPVFLPILV